ncbi:response regulator [Penaeicola halotolerans]|uniref:response regulator n=1 Tax=Penaeicola halotolerans TaxID=2793196 RepID=UPI001CF8672F|nr:response regulator [Penaeicola halotolerans]
MSDQSNLLFGKHILVVEDNPINQMYVMSLLKKWGAEVTLANHGEEAVDVFKPALFDAILMDLQMPVMDGFEATAAIRSIDSEAIIIALTANDTVESRTKCTALKMNGFVSKPFKPEDLSSLLVRLISHEILSNSPHATQNEEINYQYINLDYLKEISEGDVGLQIQMIETFIKNTPGNLSELEAAHKASDQAKCGAIVHKIKPTLAFMGINMIKDEVVRYERNQRQKKVYPEIESDYNLIKETIQQAVQELAVAIKKL